VREEGKGARTSRVGRRVVMKVKREEGRMRVEM
jgi:hypothetical protein